MRRIILIVAGAAAAFFLLIFLLTIPAMNSQTLASNALAVTPTATPSPVFLATILAVLPSDFC